MNETIFSPTSQNKSDAVASTLLRLSHGLMVLALGLLPVLFIPGIFTSLTHTKALVVAAAAAVSILLYAFVFLRSGTIALSYGPLLIAVWLVPLATLLASLLSGDLFDSMIGDAFSMQTVAGTTLMAVVTTLMIGIGKVPRRAVRLFLILLGSAVALSLWHLARLMFGADFLAFGFFGNATNSLLGGWNDVALFYGLVIILSLISIEQLTLSKLGKAFFGVIITVSLVMLSIINFFAMWLVLGFLSLAFLMYSMTRNRFSSTPTLGFVESSSTLVSSAFSGLVFLTAIIFVIGGSAVGSFISNLTNISYIEVRPSATATLDIARSVASDNVFTGVGPNRFSDAWRINKDVTLNETNFWNTDFTSGYSSLLTKMIETGLLGLFAWLAFLGLFLWVGIRAFSQSVVSDRTQHYVMLTSYSAALYIWITTIIYVPGTTIMLLGAAMTGVFLGTYYTSFPSKQLAISIEKNRQLAFVIVGLVMALIVGTLLIVYVVSRHYVGSVQFSSAVVSVQTGGDLAVAEANIAAAYQYSANDTFARELAWYQFSRMNSLVNVGEPTATEQQLFQSAVANGLNAAQLAVSRDTTDPRNWLVQGQIYSLLAGVGVEGAGDRAIESFVKAREYDPNSPLYDLLQAQMYARTAATEQSREFATAAVQKKRNYTEALSFLTELDIAENNVESAIATTRAIISIEPQNPSRYYQLGVLLSAAGQLDESIEAFTAAVTLSPDFANARYFLGISYAQAGQRDEALRELKKVQETNSDNADLIATIAAIESGESLVDNTQNPPVSNEESVTSDGEAVTAESDPETDLVSPVNVVPNQAQGE